MGTGSRIAKCCVRNFSKSVHCEVAIDNAAWRLRPALVNSVNVHLYVSWLTYVVIDAYNDDDDDDDDAGDYYADVSELPLNVQHHYGR